MSTTTTIATPCEVCGGMSAPGHPGGWLGGWHHDQDCLLLAWEDSRKVADLDLIAESWHPQRAASATERSLLGQLGFTLPTGDLLTELRSITPSVIRRTWPTLEGAA